MVLYCTICGKLFLENEGSKNLNIFEEIETESKPLLMFTEDEKNVDKSPGICNDCLCYYKYNLEQKGRDYLISCMQRAGVKKIDAEHIADFVFQYDLAKIRSRPCAAQTQWTRKYTIYYGENAPFCLLARRVTGKDYAIDTVDLGSEEASPPPSSDDLP